MARRQDPKGQPQTMKVKCDKCGALAHGPAGTDHRSCADSIETVVIDGTQISTQQKYVTYGMKRTATKIGEREIADIGSIVIQGGFSPVCDTRKRVVKHAPKSARGTWKAA